MTNVISTRLGRTWWFAGLLAGLSGLLTLPLLHAAGIPSPPETWAQWLVYFLCYVTVWRCLSFLCWFVVLLAAPSSKLLGPAKR
jgi:hypothetical protein